MGYKNVGTFYYKSIRYNYAQTALLGTKQPLFFTSSWQAQMQKRTFNDGCNLLTKVRLVGPHTKQKSLKR